jgi:ubiquinone/menaquinone biosynthesis C-methylase UbiE
MLMPASNTDHEWEKFGETDPYFGVLAHEKYKKGNLSDDSKILFFKTGEEYIHQVLANIRKHIAPTFTPQRVIDFGCGVGRLVIPLAKISQYVVGIDVSESMLKEAKKNCDLNSIENVKFIKSDDQLSALDGEYNFIHSYLVFQHIPVKRGECILEKLLAHLEPSGVGVLHFNYFYSTGLIKIGRWIKSNIPLAGNFINLIRRRKFFTPQMQMYSYNLNKVLYILEKNGITNFYAQFIYPEGKELGILLYFIMRE